MVESSGIESEMLQEVALQESESKAYAKGYNSAILEAVKSGFKFTVINGRKVAEAIQQADLPSIPLNLENARDFRSGYEDCCIYIEETCVKSRQEKGQYCGLFGCGEILPEEREEVYSEAARLHITVFLEEGYPEEARLEAVELVEKRIDELKVEMDEMCTELYRLAALGRSHIEGVNNAEERKEA